MNTHSLDLIKTPGYIDFNTIHSDGRAIKRAQGGFYANGCAWRNNMVKEVGLRPCHTYCRWPEMSSEPLIKRGVPIQNEEFLTQTDVFVAGINAENEALATQGENTVERAEIYIGGSNLNETEIPLETTVEMYKRIASIASIKEVLIEARVTDLDPEKLDTLNQVAAETGTTCIVAIGIETTNQIILKNAKKGISQSSIKRGIYDISERPNLKPQVYILVKPTVMSEQCAIDQTMTDIDFLVDAIKEHGHEGQKTAKLSINIAPVTAMEDTGADLNDAYSATSLWSVIEIIKTLEEKDALEYTTIFFGLNTETGNVTKEVTSCNQCQATLMQAINNFNATQDPSTVNDLPPCNCKNEWLKKLKNEPFISGSVHYPYDKNNPAARALYEEQLNGIMQVEAEAFPLEAQATRAQMEERIHFAGGKFQQISCNPKTGEIVAYFVTHKIRESDLSAIPENERGWDRLNKIKAVQDGDVIKGVSLGALPNAPSGASKAVAYGAFNAADKYGLKGVTGVMRLPGLSKIKKQINSRLSEITLTEQELFDIANQYLQAHLAQFSKEKEQSGKTHRSNITIDFSIRGQTVTITCPLDSNINFWGRMPLSHIGPTVYSMEDDLESCQLGVYLFYTSQNPRTIAAETSSSAGQVLNKP